MAPQRTTRPRRISNLGADIRGDTGAPAVSTLSRPEPSVSPTDHFGSKDTHPRRRRKPATYFQRWKHMSLRYTWINPLVLLVPILAAYGVSPTPSNPFHSALFLSYPLPKDKGQDPSAPIRYGKGARDFAFVAFYIIALSFVREFLMQQLIRPWALRCGIKNRAKQSRFMEQAYTALYFIVFGPFGLYVMSRSPMWYFNTTAFFEGFPHRTHDGLFKAYYLLQASYWSQQAIVLLLQLEKPRKDFKELVGHHIITIALIWLSYRFHFTHMGLAVYITHDISDFFLATSKMLNYLDSPAIGPYFAVFVGVWVYLRHFLNLRILWATLTEFRTVGPYELNWETQQYKCWISQAITFSLLACLQSVNLFWLFLILRIAKNYVFSKKHIEDERSDDEAETEHDEHDEKDDEDDESDEVGEELDPSTREASERWPGRSGKKSDVSILVNGAPVGGDSSPSPEENENYADAIKHGANGEQKKTR